MPVEPVDQPLRMPAEMVAGIETLVRLRGPEQLLGPGAERVEDLLPVGLAMDEENRMAGCRSSGIDDEEGGRCRPG